MAAPRGAEMLTTPIRHLSSPPITPDSEGDIPRSRALPNLKRMGGVYGEWNFSPPSDDEELHRKRFRTSTPELLAVPRSRSLQSQSSSGVDGSPGRRLHRPTPDADSVSEASERRPLADNDYELLIEEIGGDEAANMSRSRVLRPDATEDADSERAVSPYSNERDMIRRFQDLHHGDSNDEQQKRDVQNYMEKKKRRSQKPKRTFSQSCGSEPDDEDGTTLDFNEPGASARKKRMSGVDERRSLICHDPPHIPEADEPDEELPLIDAPPMYEETDWIKYLQSMPFWAVDDPMNIDEDDDNSTSDEEGSEPESDDSASPG